MILLTEVLLPNFGTMVHFHFAPGPAKLCSQLTLYCYPEVAQLSPSLCKEDQASTRQLVLVKWPIQRWTWYAHCTHPQLSKCKTNTEASLKFLPWASVELPAFYDGSLASLGKEDHSRLHPLSISALLWRYTINKGCVPKEGTQDRTC